MSTPSYVGWEMNDLKHIPVRNHVSMARDAYHGHFDVEATHIYCHVSQVDLFDGLGYIVKALPVKAGVINPGVFWMGIA